MQKVWLHEKGYRCQMFPFLVLGSHKPKGGWWNDAFYGKYAVHHMDRNAYENLGLEKSGDNVLVLSKFAHDWVFHWLLSFGARKAGDQKMLKFANPVQRIANKWCLVNVRMKIIVPFLIILLITLI
jgi:hypothetical protein